MMLFLGLFLGFFVNAEDLPKPMQPPQLVNDYIGLLSASERDSLEETLLRFERETSIQIAVVIIDHVITGDISSDATAIMNQWGIGQKYANNGVLVLVAKGSRKMFIGTGRGIEEYLPDALCQRICSQTMVPHFRAGNYPAGVLAGTAEIMKLLGKIPWEDRLAQQRLIEEKKAAEDADALRKMVNILIVIAILLLAFFTLRWIWKRGRRVKEKVNQLIKYYQLIVEDEIGDTSKWPNWARKQLGTSVADYAAAEAVAGKLVADLPKWWITRLFSRRKTLEATEKHLEIFEEYDKFLTKLRNEVNLYKTRAPQALAEVQVNYRTLQTLYNQSGEPNPVISEKIQKIGEEIKTLGIPDDESSRQIFLKALDLDTSIKKIDEGIREYAKAKKWVLEAIQRAPKEDEEVQRYESRFPGLFDQLSGYPATVFERIASGVAFSTMLIGYRKATILMNSLVQGNEPNKYALALDAFRQRRDHFERIGKAYYELDSLIAQLLRFKESYSTDVVNTENVIASAQQKVNDSDVETATRDKFNVAKNTLVKAKKLATQNPADWILVRKLLTEAEDLANTAKKDALQDIANAKESRSKAERARQASIRTSSYNYTSRTSSGGSRGGFGGFGGGSSGGGGGGASW